MANIFLFFDCELRSARGLKNSFVVIKARNDTIKQFYEEDKIDPLLVEIQFFKMFMILMAFFTIFINFMFSA
jgi:predicted CDP-diglyceride synthetase/phosphatidate cytidylyltransferase